MQATTLKSACVNSAAINSECSDFVLGALNWRYAVKKFDNAQKIPDDTWRTLESALLLTPSAYGLQPWYFIVVQDPDLRRTLMKSSLNQSQVVDASHFVVFAAKTSLNESYVDEFVNEMARARGVSRKSLEPYFRMVVADMVQGSKEKPIGQWAAKQAYIALGNLATTAAMLGIDTCPMEGIEPEAYDEVLGLKGGDYRTAMVCALGYRHSEDKYAHLPKVRFEKKRVIRYL